MRENNSGASSDEDRAGRASPGVADASPPSGDHPSRGGWQRLDTLPRAEWVIIACENGDVMEAYADKYGVIYRGGTVMEVTHWMPLPTPPASAIEARRDETQGGSGEAESAVVADQTPEALALWELIKADPFGDSPLKAIADAIAAAERAAYRRARKVALDYYAFHSVEYGSSASVANAVANVADAILSLIDKEPT